MGDWTSIGWTDHTFNPWHGCTKVEGSPACDHCYAETFSIRTGRTRWGDDADRWFPTDAYWRHPLKWNDQAAAEGRPHLVFCASMGDVFEDRRDLDPHRARLWDLIEATPWLRWQLLTKRPENVCGPNAWLVKPEWVEEPGDWPANAWVGVTVEDQAHAEERIGHLLHIPAPLRFLSCEPLLGPIDLDGVWGYPGSADGDDLERWPIGWVIVGGESGGGRRPTEVAWVESLAEQCDTAGVPLFVKQGTHLHSGRQGQIPDHLWARKELPALHPPTSGTL